MWDKEVRLCAFYGRFMWDNDLIYIYSVDGVNIGGRFM